MCDIFVSQYVESEAGDGNVAFAAKRKASMANATWLDGTIPEVLSLANALMCGRAVPEDEATDAFHIATAAVYGMDVLLTWNCRHMANPVTLPKTFAIIAKTGFHCPIVITPDGFLARRDEFGL